MSKISVSIHAPAWGATRRVGISGSPGCWFQSTRPRGARHDSYRGYGEAGGVSIHAPAGGATDNQGIEQASGQVSIHAPAWGATIIQMFG